MLSSNGEVVDKFSLATNDEGYAVFASRVPKDARIVFEATVMAYPYLGRLRNMGTEASP